MQSSKPTEVWSEFLRNGALAVLFAVGIRTAVAEPFHVPSESMEPTKIGRAHV